MSFDLSSHQLILVYQGPREICIVRDSAIPLIYGLQSECLKSTWYMQVSSDHTKCSLHLTRDLDDHRHRRRAWDRGVSIKGRPESLFSYVDLAGSSS